MQESQLVQEVKVFEPFKAQLNEMEATNKNTVFDYEDLKGRKDAKSHIYKLRQTKSAVEKARKEAKQSSLEFGRRIDGQAKDLSLRIEGMMNVHLLPIQKVEEEEAKIKKEISDKIEKIRSYSQKINPVTQGFFTYKELDDRYQQLIDIVIDKSYGEWEIAARDSRLDSIDKIEMHMEEAQDREAKEAELQRFRKEEAERKAKEQQEKIDREAKERADREAEKKLERERQEAADREAKLKKDAQDREDRIKREAQQREEKIKRDAKAREEKLKREKDDQVRKAREREDRIKREAKEKKDKEEREKLRREADQRNRQSVESKIINDLRSVGIKEDTARHLIRAINENKVPKLIIRY